MGSSDLSAFVAERGSGARRNAVLALALVAATIAILFWRRPDQFLAPAIWAEEWAAIAGYAERGWASIVEPIQGYRILATRLVVALALQLSFVHAPELALWITVTLICLTVLAVALSPTHLRLRPLCGLSLLLVPTDAEVLGPALFAFWWAGILLFLTVLWSRGAQWLRAGYLLFGGLSSPLVGPVAVLLAARAALERTRSAVVIALLALALTAVQAVTAYFHMTNAGEVSFAPAMVNAAVARLVGFFYFAAARISADHYAYVGYAMLAAFAVMIWAARARLDRYFLLLVLLWAACCALVVVRVPLGLLHPFGGGPRYFYYPFILMIWAGLWIAAVSGRTVKLILTTAYVAALWFALRYDTGYKYVGFVRRHDPIDWAAHVQRCVQADRYVIPIHSVGETGRAWMLQLTGVQCRALLAGSLWK